MDTAAAETLMDAVKFDDKGLVAAIAQDAETGEVLMFAWMNRESLGITLTGGAACYWSRSRAKLWLKGETSGNTQKVLEVRLDCDGDALVLKIEQEGGACHTGARSCFHRVERDGRWRGEGGTVFDAAAVYGAAAR